MANVKTVQIEGFQSHHYSELQFEDGLNVIIGASDQGKSAVIRALRWALFNEPRGAEFIRVGETLCRVTVTLDNQTVIVRERNQTGSKNRYILRVPGLEEQVFEGFSHQGVPEEIVRAHGMRKVALDEDQERVLNFGQQLEGSFLLSENGALKAKAIGRIAGIHILDFAGKNVIKDLNRLSTEKRRTEEDLNNIRKSLTDYEDLPGMLQQLEKLTGLHQQIEKKEERLSRFHAFEVKSIRIRSGKEETERVLASLQQLSISAEKIKNIQSLVQRLITIEGIQERWKKNQSGMLTEQTILKETSSLQKAEQMIAKMNEKQRELEKVTNVFTKWKDAYNQKQKSVNLLETLKHVFTVEKHVVDVQKLRDIGSSLSKLRTRYKEVKDRLQRCERAIQQLQGTGAAEDKLQQLQKLPLRERELQLIGKRYNAIRVQLEELKKEKDVYHRNIRSLLREYEDALHHAGKCPTCYSEINDGVIDRIIEEYSKGGKEDGRELRRAN